MNPGMRELASGFEEMAAPKKNRKSPRAQVSLVARYRSPTAFEFVQEECFDLSLGGMFIRSPAPAPAGTLIKLECDVNGATGTIRGVARVVWLREHSADNQPAGMGVKFVKLEPGARDVIAGILEQLGADRDDRDTARPLAPQSNPAQPSKQTPSTRPGAQDAAASAKTPSKPSPSQPSASTSTPAAVSTAVAKTSDPAPAQASPSPLPPIGPLTDSGRPAAPDLRGRLEQAKRIQAEQQAATARIVAIAAETDAKNATSAAAKRTSKDGAPRAAAPAPAVTAVAPAAAVSAGSNKGLAYALVALAAGGVLFVVLSRNPAPAKDASAHAAAMQPEPTPAPSAIERPPPPAAYVLEVATTPDGARVTAGARELTTPGSIELGQLEEPVQLTAAKDGFEPTTATIDRVGFMLEDGAMRRRIELTLTARAAEAVPAPEPVATPEPAPAPIAAPAPAPAPAKLAAKSETKSSRSARETSVQPRRAAHVEAPVATAAPVEAPAPAEQAAPVVQEPKPEPAAPVLTIAPAGEAKPAAAEPKPAPAPEAKPAERQFVEAKPVEPAKKSDAKLTPMQAAAACLSTGDNACVVKALEGKAKSPQELELLIETYKTMGDSGKAEKWMKTYVDKYPTERRANTYRRMLDRPKEEAAAAP